MPIKSSALSASTDDETKPDEATEPKPAAKAKAGPRKRRSRAELIADAVVPGDNDEVDVKFTATGTKAQRTWLVAVELFREDKIEFVDKNLKYAVMKMDEQRKQGQAPAPDAKDDAANTVEGLATRWVDLQSRIDQATPASDEANALIEEADNVRNEIISLGGEDPQSDEAYASRSGEPEDRTNVPPEAEVGDEVVIGADTYRVGHGEVLTQGVVGTPEGEVIAPKRRWQRELGTGANGPWESKLVAEGAKASGVKLEKLAEKAPAEVTVERTVTESSAEPVNGSAAAGIDLMVWKVTMGYKEKIGLPDYSNLEVGPASAQRYVRDDGRRTKIVMHGREVSIPTAAIEAMQEAAQVCEFVMRAERTAMINFLEAVKPGSTAPQQG